jgi:hypothetical protein
VSARYTEPYGFAGYVHFWLYTTGGTKIVENWSGLTTSGAMATLAIPNLAPGTYNLWAMPWDTRQTGPQIGPNTFTVATPPGQPATVTVTANADGSVVVEWTPPTSTGGAAVDSFAVNAYYTGATPVYTGEQRTACGTCTSTMFTRLSPMKTYTFAVFAHNAAGYGSARSSGESTPQRAELPDLLNINGLVQSLLGTFGARLGRTWMEWDAGDVDVMKVGLVNPGSGDAAQLQSALVAANASYGNQPIASRVEVVPQRYGAAQLAGFESAVADVLASPDADSLTSAAVWIDNAAGKLLVSVDHAVAVVSQRIAQAVPADAYTMQIGYGLAPNAETRRTLPFRSGKEIRIPAGLGKNAQCTTGFMFRRNGLLVGTTAGHCTFEGDEIYLGSEYSTGPSRAVAGDNVFRENQFSIDAAILAFYPGSQADASVYVSSDRILPVRQVRANADIKAGTRVCWVGSVTTDRKCGNVTAVNMPFFTGKYRDIRTDRDMKHTTPNVYCAVPSNPGDNSKYGDSGGPVFRYIGVDGGRDNASEAVGMVVGTYGPLDAEGNPTGPLSTCFVTVQNIGSTYGMSVEMG